jgi:hypothetical protein
VVLSKQQLKTLQPWKKEKEKVLVIYNIFGQEVMKTRAVPQNRSVSLSISGLSPGVYLVTCRDAKQGGLKGKFVLRDKVSTYLLDHPSNNRFFSCLIALLAVVYPALVV